MVLLLYRAHLVVQRMAPPPPEKPLARIRLYVNGKAAVSTPSTKITLRIPRLTNKAALAAGDSAEDGADNLELEVAMEADDDHASDAKDGLARCVRKQAAGMLEEYEEDGQQLPADDNYQSEDDDGELTNADLDIIRDVEKFTQQPDNPVSDPEDESGDDNTYNDTYNESSDEGDKSDGDFIPARLKLKGKDRSKGFKATGGKKCIPTVNKDANYTFCPLPHRLSILRLMGKHFCQHPILPECSGEPRTAQQIHHDAVLEAYYHCRANNLREVWAYLWTNWYTKEKWVSWARSSCEHAIPWKRTTMLVEALWRNLKRMVLYQYNRPRVDFATYALVTQSIPPYRVRFNEIVKNPRDGRAKILHGEQIPIKKAWLDLCTRPIKGTYATNVRLWTCSCGAQKYHSYLLCKHLVQALPVPGADWWATVFRRHTLPFYDILELLPEDK